MIKEEKLPAIFHDRAYWKTLMLIALPVSLQNFFSASLNLVDNVMVGQLGDTALASVGISNTVFFLMIVLIFGVGSGCSIFIAQYYGRGDHKGIKHTVAIGYILCIVLSSVFMILTLLLSERIMGIFTNDQEVIRLGAEYLRIVSISYPLTALANILYGGLRSTKKAVMPLLVSLISILTNTGLNALLIYGMLGFPALGVKGAAIATLFARIVEFLVLFIVVYVRKYAIRVMPSDLRGIKAKFVKELLKVSLPVIANEFFWALGMSTFTVLYARLGTDYVAGYNILQTIDRISFALSMGIASASAAMVGHKIGERRIHAAYVYALRTNVIGIFLGTVVGVLLIITSGNIVNLFRISTEARGYAQILIFMFGLILPIKTLNLENLLGALRAGGDTRFSLLAELLPLWIITIPLSFYFGWNGLVGVGILYLITISDEVIKAVLGLIRFFSKRWINILPGAELER